MLKTINNKFIITGIGKHIYYKLVKFVFKHFHVSKENINKITFECFFSNNIDSYIDNYTIRLSIYYNDNNKKVFYFLSLLSIKNKIFYTKKELKKE